MSADQFAASSADTIPLLILGAGPAGIAAALRLIQYDPAWAKCLIVLEKAAHPRPKPCGGGVTYYGQKMLQSLGITLPLPIPHVDIHEIQLSYRRHIIHIFGKSLIIVFERQAFDAQLAQYARQKGVIIHENEPALSLDIDSSGVTVATPQKTYRALIVIGADGCNGIARRYLNRNIPCREMGRLLTAQLPAPGDSLLFTQHIARFDFTPIRCGLQGYFWQFPMVKKGLPAYNLGVYDALINKNGRRANLPELLTQGCRNQDINTAENLSGYPVHRFAPRNIFSHPRLLLAGDAAGVDPLFSEGIAPSLNYGCLAAAMVQDAFYRQDFSFRHYRRFLFKSSLGRFLLFHWAVAGLVYRFCRFPLFMPIVWLGGNLAAWLWSDQPTQIEYQPKSP
ncbi:MAG: FAD-dependent monooxygenase [Anaerolineales bacterium]|nr:FAD-dependent monooxygenase [Anaerolineales bacterium]